MKRLFTGFAVTFVTVVWMMGSWFFFNIVATGVERSDALAAAEVNKGDCAGHHWRHKHHFRLWKKLNLTDAQKKEMFSIRLDERAIMKPLFEKLRSEREQLHALPMGQFDEAKIRAIAKGQADTLTELLVEKQRMKSKLYAVLTPEQRAKAEQIRQEWKARRAEECKKHKD
jgi:protein CpxP